MAVDLPSGKYTAQLVGAWWPQPSSMLHSAAHHWSAQQQQQETYARALHDQWTQLAAQNHGRTADDLISRFQRDEKRHNDFAEKYKAKANAFSKTSDAVDALREGLRGVADDYNQRIASVETSKKSTVIKTAEIESLIAEANGFATYKSGVAEAAIADATQKILNVEGIAISPQQFLDDHRRKIDKLPTLAEPNGIPGNDGAGLGMGGLGSRTGEEPLGASGAGLGRPGSGGHLSVGAPGGSGAGAVPWSGKALTAPVSSAPMPGAPVASGPPLSGMAAPLAPASLGQGLSPNSLGQSFISGMATGQPAGAGAQSLSSGAMQAMGTGSVPPMQPIGAGSVAAPQALPPLAPPAVPSIPMAGSESLTPASGPIDAPTTSAPPASTTGGGVPVAPAVMTGGSWPASATGGPVAPAGPLPAYGSDLRQPVVAPPAMVSTPTAPVSGSPVAPTTPSSPSTGGPIVSAAERAAFPTAAGQPGVGSSSLAGASAASAATGATVGAASSRAAEQRRLQRIVDAVARQEPHLSWAAALRDDGTTTLLVTDLACGWIPPHVRLPAHLTLLEPAARRRDASVVDLLGAVVTAAAHQPGAYVAEPGPDAPALSGDRPARSQAPTVDELGPTLVDAVRRRDGLPRIAQAVATPAVRKTGVLENEATLLRACLADVRRSVLNAYPAHDPAAVADWMLLAAVEALIGDREYLANYHLAWFNALTSRNDPKRHLPRPR